MKRLVSPLVLVLALSLLSLGWRATPPAHPLGDTRAMTLAGSRLFVAGGYTGLHIYDVSNPSAPQKLARIPLDNSKGIAVKDDILYANDAGQLVVMQMGDHNTYTVVARIGAKYQSIDNPPNPGNDDSSFSCMCTTGTFDPAADSPGTGSSYATFAVVDNSLYLVVGSGISVYDISNAAKPEFVYGVGIGVGPTVESIYPTADYLFVGGTTGMYVFSRSDPNYPRMIARIDHARGCDPVVVSGSTAYVTLRGSNNCGAAPDELLCVSIADPAKPEVVGEKSLATPWGLAVRDSKLYVSHGTGGYSLIDVSDPANVAVLQTWSGEATRDFIWSGTTLFVLNEDNVSIYDVTDPSTPVRLSQVEPPAPAL